MAQKYFMFFRFSNTNLGKCHLLCMLHNSQLYGKVHNRYLHYLKFDSILPICKCIRNSNHSILKDTKSSCTVTGYIANLLIVSMIFFFLQSVSSLFVRDAATRLPHRFQIISCFYADFGHFISKYNSLDEVLECITHLYNHLQLQI